MDIIRITKDNMGTVTVVSNADLSFINGIEEVQVEGAEHRSYKYTPGAREIQSLICKATVSFEVGNIVETVNAGQTVITLYGKLAANVVVPVAPEPEPEVKQAPVKRQSNTRK